MEDNRNDEFDFREVTEDGKEINNDKKDDGKTSGNEKKEFEDVRFVCRRPESKAGKMFHLPNNICICDDCMHRTMDAVSQFDYQNMLNNPGLMNELNKNMGQNFGFFNMDGMNMGGGIPNSQKIR